MTVTPAADPCVGNLATPVNSGYFIKGLINNLPLYRPGISPNFRGLETGAAFGYLLYGPFTICGPLRATEYQQTAGLLAAIGAVHILSLLFLLYNQPGKQPNMVWDDGALDIPRIAVVASNDRGRSWSEPIHLGAGNHTAAYPHAGFPEANTITVFWNERGSADQPSREPDHSGEVWVDASPGSATPRLLKQSVSLN